MVYNLTVNTFRNLFNKCFIDTIHITNPIYTILIYYIICLFLEESDNAGDAFLDKLTKQRVKLGDMIKDLEGEKFFNFLQVIRQDLGKYEKNSTLLNKI